MGDAIRALCPRCWKSVAACVDVEEGDALLAVHRNYDGQRCPTSLTRVPLETCTPAEPLRLAAGVMQ